MRSGAAAAKTLLVAGCATLTLLVTVAAASATSHASELPIPPPVRPYQPGDHVWYGDAPVVTLPSRGTGCERVPSTGYLATGASARTTGEYSSYWNWSAGSAAEPYDWWIYTSGGTLEASGSSGGGSGARTVPANVNYWKVKNLGADPQAWNACWSG